MPLPVRTDTPMNRLADAIVVALQNISQKKDSKYLTNPNSVQRTLMVGDFTGKQKPLLALSLQNAEFEPQAAQRFEGVFTFAVHCITENTVGAEAELLRLVSDVILALAADVNLDGQAMYLFPRSFEPNVEAINRTGLGVTTLTYECRYKFDSTAP